jgi:hypothetical protein
VRVTDFVGYHLSARNQLGGTTASVTNDAANALALAVPQ